MNIKETAKFFIAGSGLLLSLVFLWGCIGRGPEPPKIREPMPADFQTRISQFIYDGWGFKLGKTRAEIERNLGRPLASTGKEVPNLHYPERTDEIFELGYTGLRISIYRVSETRKEIVTAVAITSARYRLKWGIKVGCPIDDVQKVFGYPSEEREGVISYETGEEAPSSVSFYFRNGLVYKIYWAFYID
jgi:hypothetical protein